MELLIIKYVITLCVLFLINYEIVKYIRLKRETKKNE